MKDRVTFLLPHMRPSGGVRHILELAAGLSALGWSVRVRVTGIYGNVSRSEGTFKDELESLGDWWGGSDSAGAAGLVFEHGSMRSLRPMGQKDTSPLAVPGGVRTRASHHQIPDWGSEVVVAYGDGENEQFQSTYLARAVAVLLVLDWLVFDPARQLRYLRQGWDAVACSTPFLADRIRDSVPAVQYAFVVGAGIDTNEFHRVPVRSDGATVGCLYDPMPSKGWKDALTVMGRLAPGARLLAYGTAEAPPDPGSGIQFEYVRLPGIREKREIYSRCDAWLCPSHSEGYGFPSLEAAACGVPVVTYRNGGHSAFQVDGVTGAFADVGDVAGLYSALFSVLESPARASVMGTSARDRAVANTWEAAALRMEACLRAAISAVV